MKKLIIGLIIGFVLIGLITLAVIGFGAFYLLDKAENMYYEPTVISEFDKNKPLTTEQFSLVINGLLEDKDGFEADNIKIVNRDESIKLLQNVHLNIKSDENDIITKVTYQYNLEKLSFSESFSTTTLDDVFITLFNFNTSTEDRDKVMKLFDEVIFSLSPKEKTIEKGFYNYTFTYDKEGNITAIIELKE